MNRPTVALLAALSVCASVFVVPHAASAFCGFYVSGADTNLYNNATMVVMMRDGTRTVLSMQNNYQGPAEDFAMVVPVPVVLQQEDVRTLPADVFDRVDQMASPRLVEYWEQDPCYVEMEDDADEEAEEEWEYEREWEGEFVETGGVVVEAQFAVGEYNIVILSADDSTGLDTWLRTNGYNIPANAEENLRPYVQSGMYFFVAEVDLESTTFDYETGQALLSPLRFHYDSDTFSLPIRLGLINAGAVQDLIVHVLAPGQRYEVANYGNVTIPTNLIVGDAVRDQFGQFYAALLDATLERHPGSVVTEYSWNASSCDPCPGTQIFSSDFYTLGADVIPSGSTSFVLTRLHARYAPGDITEDLVFRAAPPITGGRGTPHGDTMPTQTVTSSGSNDFQGRYMIMHPWEGPITCENPRRGIWGGPPSGYQTPVVAEDMGMVERADLDLEELVESSISAFESGATP